MNGAEQVFLPAIRALVSGPAALATEAICSTWLSACGHDMHSIIAVKH
jgi:hypothetical protein